MSTRNDRWPAIEAAVFRTITGADWAVALRRARAQRNEVREKILARAGAAPEKILDPVLGKSESKPIKHLP